MRKIINAETRLSNALERIRKEASKNNPDPDKIAEIATSALEYEAARNFVV